MGDLGRRERSFVGGERGGREGGGSVGERVGKEKEGNFWALRCGV